MSNETIFREVDEELRGDRMRQLWNRFGPYLIGGAVAVVLVVAGNEGWSWWQASNAARSSDQFYAALELAETGDIDGAQAALDTVQAEASGGYPTLARFRQASLLAAEGQREEAIAAYDALSTSETNPRLRELALVLSAYLLVDDGNVAAVEQRVGGLVTPDNPMRSPAREAIGLTQYQAGEFDAALATFEDVLSDPLTGPEIRERVQIYAAQLVALGAGEAADEAASQEAAPADADVPAVEAAAATETAAPVEEEPVPEIPAPLASGESAADAPESGEPAADASAD